MNSRPTRSTTDGRIYLALQNDARRSHRNTQDLLRLYALEGFLARLATSRHEPKLVLKGGVLLAAYGLRRATRDIDLQARRIPNDTDSVLAIACARYRSVDLNTLAYVLGGWAEGAQPRWGVWLRKQTLPIGIPHQFSEVVAEVASFADPVLSGEITTATWDPSKRTWRV